MKLRTWHFESLVVYAVLIGANSLAGSGWREWLGACAVALGWHHASVASRLAEAEERRITKDVPCYRWLTRYWVGKEVLWLAYFASMRSVSGLVGCLIFAVHPFWRRWYRQRFPVDWQPLSP